MAERIVSQYKRLFEVRLLHHYWLDDGHTMFDNLIESRRNKLLLTYDCRTFIQVNPTSATVNTINALKGVFKQTSLGFLVAVPGSVNIPDDAVFSFVLTVTDASFNNYTSFTLLSRNIVELYYKPEDKVYRYKQNVPVFSNLTGVSHGVNPDITLFLSSPVPVSSPTTDIVEFLNISAGALVQLTSSQPGATNQEISPVASNAPVFVHQNDAPLINPPSGMTGTPERGILLSGDLPDDIFGLIQITAKNQANPDFSLTAGGIAKDVAPVFQLRFKNRLAFWRYLNKTNGALNSESSTPLPFTNSGNAGTNKKPGGSLVKVKFENDDPTKRIEKIYTEIFE